LLFRRAEKPLRIRLLQDAVPGPASRSGSLLPSLPGSTCPSLYDLCPLDQAPRRDASSGGLLTLCHTWRQAEPPRLLGTFALNRPLVCRPTLPQPRIGPYNRSLVPPHYCLVRRPRHPWFKFFTGLSPPLPLLEQGFLLRQRLLVSIMASRRRAEEVPSIARRYLLPYAPARSSTSTRQPFFPQADRGISCVLRESSCWLSLPKLISAAELFVNVDQMGVLNTADKTLGAPTHPGDA